MTGDLQIGGRPVAVIEDLDASVGFVRAQVLPGRGMTLLQAWARTPSLGDFEALEAPPAAEAARLLDGGADDFAGNKAFSLGGAILLPYANRITGKDIPGAREIAAEVDSRPARLPRNWGGKTEGARQYAMHGLILDRAADAVEQPARRELRARFDLGDFGGRWPGQMQASVAYKLEGGALTLAVEVRNLGGEPLPLGLGWHPYFRLPSGRRDQARLRVPAEARAPANNYDEVLPIGEVLPVAGGDFDFRTARPLGGLYLDDCFTELTRDPDGRLVCEVLDPAAAYGVRIVTDSPAVKAVQVYAPPDKPFVVLEPQFNLADPYSPVWPASVDTGMLRLPVGGTARYQVRLELVAP